MILTRKVQIYPVGDKEEVNRVYKYLRDGIFNQNKAMNQYMSALYVSTMENVTKDNRQELNRLYTRIATRKVTRSRTAPLTPSTATGEIAVLHTHSREIIQKLRAQLSRAKLGLWVIEKICICVYLRAT